MGREGVENGLGEMGGRGENERDGKGGRGGNERDGKGGRERVSGLHQ